MVWSPSKYFYKDVLLELSKDPDSKLGEVSPTNQGRIQPTYIGVK